MYCRELPSIAMYRHVSPCIAMCCRVLQSIAMYCHAPPGMDMYRHIVVVGILQSFKDYEIVSWDLDEEQHLE